MTELTNQIIGKLLTREKYRLIDPRIISEVARDTMAAFMQFQRDVRPQSAAALIALKGPGFHRINDMAQTFADQFKPLPPVERFPAANEPEIRPI